jgi:hypothetical protein
MNEAWLKATRCSVSDDLFMVVFTSIVIYDAAITLFDEPSPGGVEMPGPAHIASMRSILSSLGIGDEGDEDAFLA